MIQTVYSNSYEFLRSYLIELVAAERSHRGRGAFDPAAAFARTEIIAPSEAVRDDLMRSFADRTGIASGLDIKFFSGWFESVTGAMVGNSQAGRELEWIVWALLKDEAFLSRPECRRLAHYVHGQSARGLSVLARRICNVLTAYVSYRLDWVLDWMQAGAGRTLDSERRAREAKVLQAAADTEWQRAMVFEIVRRRWGLEKRSWSGADNLRSIPELFARLHDERPAQKACPLHIFLPSVLPPLALPYLWALAPHRELTVYLINPSQSFWFDASSAPSPHEDESDRGLFAPDALDWLHRNAARQRALIERVWTFAGDMQSAGSLVEDDFEAPAESLETLNDFIGRARKIAPTETIDMGKVLEMHAENADEPVVCYVEPARKGVLFDLQRAVLADSKAKLPHEVAAGDDSFRIVKAPSAARELEAVFDWIESLREKAEKNGETLSAADILVATPDIDAIAPLAAAVMNERPESTRMAVRIAGRSELDVNSAAQALIAAARFIYSRAGCDELMALMEYPLSTRSRGLLGCNFEAVRTWLATAGLRWGLTAAHARHAVERGYAADEGGEVDGTLARALERLQLGALLRGDVRTGFADVLPVQGSEVQGYATTQSAPELFEFLLSFSAALLRGAETAPDAMGAEGELKPGARAADWYAWLKNFAADLFPGELADTELLRLLRCAEAAAQTAESVLSDAPVDFETFILSVSETIRVTQIPARATGAVTLAPMEAFRNIPFKAIAVVGLNDGTAFPGVNRSEEFDLMVAECVEDGRVLNARRKGDRDSRASNRNVFLDLLTACRGHFMVSYTIGTGRIEATPSVVLQDLKQTLALGLGGEDAVEKLLTVTLPAGEFDFANFTEAASLWKSRSGERLAALKAARKTRFLGQNARFLDAGVAPHQSAGESGMIGLNAFVRFVHEPEKWVEKAAGILRVQNEDVLAASVDAPVDGLSKHRAKTVCLERLRASPDRQDEIEAIIADARRDPINGVAGLRAGNVRDPLAFAAAVAGCERELTRRRSAAGELAAGVLRFDGAAPFAGIECGPAQLFDDDAGTPTIVETELSKRDTLRVWLRHLVRSLASRPCRVSFATASIYFTDGAAGVRRYAPIEPGSEAYTAAYEIVWALLCMLNRQAASPMAVADPPPNYGGTPPAEFAAVWLGCEQQRPKLVSAARKVEDALKAAREFFEDKACAAHEEAEAAPTKKTKKKTSKSKKAPATLADATEDFIKATQFWEETARAAEDARPTHEAKENLS